MAMSAWFDPRLTVFIIWGFFILLFICIPTKRFVAHFFRMIGIPCCDEEDEEERGGGGFRRDETDYEYLSSERKQEIDNLRSIALLRHLSKFSLKLKKENMVRRLSDAQTGGSISAQTITSMCHASILQEEKTPSKHASSTVKDADCELCEISLDSKEEKRSDLNDVEKGADDTRGVDPPEANEAESEADQYTHVLIPCPGHDVGCASVCESESKTSCHSNGEKRSSRVLRFSIHSKKEKEEKKELSEEEASEEKDVKEVEEKGGGGKEEKRDVSIFCAICLMEYEISERVCWASNPDCTHVFHEDCIIKWLVSLGRTKSKMQSFSDNPSEMQLLNYQLECPCCRQEFILKSVSPPPEFCGEENV